MKQLRYPTPDEMIALTTAARRRRARMLGVLVRLGVRALKSRLALADPAEKSLSHA
jgi:hypothetical protein